MPDRDIPPPPRRLPQPRNGGRTQLRSPHNQGDRDAWAAARWTLDGWTLREIADALELKSKSAAHDSVQRGLRTTREPLQADAERARAAHRARLGYVLEVVTEAMECDDGRTLAALAGKVKELSESLRKLDGIDAPMRHELTMRDIDAALDDVTKRLSDLGAETEEATGAEGPQG